MGVGEWGQEGAGRTSLVGDSPLGLVDSSRDQEARQDWPLRPAPPAPPGRVAEGRLRGAGRRDGVEGAGCEPGTFSSADTAGQPQKRRGGGDLSSPALSPPALYC